MRLTLRTLLAYLDDTLDPAQARQIGEKVAESTVAQELIEKIKRVARRRSLTIPTTAGPDAADPNLVAEYLDNDLPVDKVGEIEEQALHSDVHLAEIAACHQLLTLIMSEPAKVPPTARQRMYGLVKGPEVDSTRAAPRVAPATIAELEEPDDTEGHILVSRRGGRTRLWIAGALAIGLIAVVWIAMQHPYVQPSTPAATPPVQADRKEPLVVADSSKDKEAAKPPGDAPKDAPTDQPKEMTQPTEPVNKPATEPEKAPNRDLPPPPAAKPDGAVAQKPSDDRKEVGKFASGAVLLNRPQDSGEWKRLAVNGPIVGTTRLLALPGINDEVRLGNIVVELFGTMADIYQEPLFESSVTVFVPADGFAADIRLDRGRVYIRASNPTGAKARIRLVDDFFDIKFDDDKSEVIVERICSPDGVPYSRDSAAQKTPVAFGGLAVTQGHATVQRDLGAETKMVAGPKPTMWRWSSTGAAAAPEELAEPNPMWGRTPVINGPERATAIEMDQAIKRLPRQLSDVSKPINLAMSELLLDRTKPIRRIAVFSQAALDDLAVLDVLDDPTNAEQRQAALFAVHNWLGRSADRAGILVDALIKQKRFTQNEADAALQLWFGFTDSELKEPRPYAITIEALSSDKLPVRELALWRLATQLDQDGARAIRYIPTDAADVRQRAVAEWKRRIPEGQLPPGKMK